MPQVAERIKQSKALKGSKDPWQLQIIFSHSLIQAMNARIRGVVFEEAMCDV